MNIYDKTKEARNGIQKRKKNLRSSSLDNPISSTNQWIPELQNYSIQAGAGKEIRNERVIKEDLEHLSKSST